MHSFIIFKQDVYDVLSVLLPDILHDKIVNHEGERNGEVRVCPETRGVFGGSVSVGGKYGFYFCVGEDAGLGETVHPLSDFEEHPAVRGDILL